MATRKAPNHRQNASAIGGTMPTTPRPRTMFAAQKRLARINRIQAEFQKRRMGGSVGAGPAVAAWIGAGHANAVPGDADGLHTAWAVQRGQPVEAVAQVFQSIQHVRAELRLDGEAAIAFMLPVRALALLAGGPARCFQSGLRVRTQVQHRG